MTAMPQHSDGPRAYRRQVLRQRNQRPQRMAWDVTDKDGKKGIALMALNRAVKRLTAGRVR